MVIVVVGPLALDPQPAPAAAVRGSMSEAIEIRNGGVLRMWARGRGATNREQSEATERVDRSRRNLEREPRAPQPVKAR